MQALPLPAAGFLLLLCSPASSIRFLDTSSPPRPSRRDWRYQSHPQFSTPGNAVLPLHYLVHHSAKVRARGRGGKVQSAWKINHRYRTNIDACPSLSLPVSFPLTHADIHAYRRADIRPLSTFLSPFRPEIRPPPRFALPSFTTDNSSSGVLAAPIRTVHYSEEFSFDMVSAGDRYAVHDGYLSR